MTQSAEPPHRRLMFTLTAEAHDLTQLAQELERIAYDLQARGEEQRESASSAGYHYKLEITDPAMTAERHAAELQDWWTARKRQMTSAREQGS